MSDWTSIPRPAEVAEQRLLDGILSGHFPINSSLPAERELAAQIGVTRPTLREALQRLARDGWLDIQHGKPTRVRDYWHEGSLAVLAALATSSGPRSPEFVRSVMEIRILLAPAYTRQAVEAAAQQVADCLDGYDRLPDTAEAYAQADWELHHRLTRLAANPIFHLLNNDFASLYQTMGPGYFATSAHRAHSRSFYTGLRECARRGDGAGAETLTRRIMQESVAFLSNKEQP